MLHKSAHFYDPCARDVELQARLDQVLQEQMLEREQVAGMEEKARSYILKLKNKLEAVNEDLLEAQEARSQVKTGACLQTAIISSLYRPFIAGSTERRPDEPTRPVRGCSCWDGICDGIIVCCSSG